MRERSRKREGGWRGRRRKEDEEGGRWKDWIEGREGGVKENEEDGGRE